MKRWAGWWLLGVAALHTAGGITRFKDDLAAMAQAGLVNTVRLGSEHFGAYFFLLWGFICVVLAFAVNELERLGISPFPRTVAYSLAVFTVVSIAVAPSSGFWTLIPPSIALILRSHKKTVVTD